MRKTHKIQRESDTLYGKYLLGMCLTANIMDSFKGIKQMLCIIKKRDAKIQNLVGEPHFSGRKQA